MAVLLFIAAPSLSVAGGVTGPGPADPPTCQPPSQIADPAGAVARNLQPLSAPSLCVSTYGFKEGEFDWRLLVVRNTARPGSVLWVVPHDNEGTGFDSAVYGVRRYGGTVVAVKTGGQRFNAH